MAQTSFQFGNAWAKPGPSQKCVDVREAPKDQCMHKTSTVTFVAQRKCQAIMRSEFAKCHSKVDPLPFFYSCREDMCECDAKEKCLCSSFEQYSRMCAHHGVVLDWRSSTKACRKTLAVKFLLHLFIVCFVLVS